MITKSAWLPIIIAMVIALALLLYVMGSLSGIWVLCVLLIIALTVWSIFLFSRLKEEKKRADSEKRRADEFGEVLVDRFGYQTGKLEIEATIKNYQGDCDTRWVWSEIRGIHPDYPLASFPGKMYFSTPNALFVQYPTLLPEYSGNYGIEFLNKEASRCLFQIKVINAANEIEFGYNASINSAFCMTEEELSGEMFKDEWFGFTTTGIIETLTIKVSFPKQYKPDSVHLDVCMGTIPVDASETDEVKKIMSNGGIKSESTGLSITVNKPKLGYLYFIRWRPLPGDVVDGMRTRET